MSDKRAQGFLQHITAEPDDDAPRLIYADWLDEHGDSVRAEFIRIQVERARLPKWDPRQARLGLREKELLLWQEAKWKLELPVIEGITWGEFRRGFIATATFPSFAALRKHAADCWAAAPIEAVTVRWPRRRESCESIAPIAGLRELHINGNLVDPDDVRHLVEAPLLSTLRVLSIPNANMMAEGFQWLVTSPHLENLKALRLPGNSIGNGGIRALFDAASLTSLEELDLSERDSYSHYGEDPVIESIGLEALMGWPGMAYIRSLTLSGNSVGQRGLRALLRSPRNASLKELVLRDNGLLGQALHEFEAARPKLQLEVLDLGENTIMDLGAASLARANCLSELKVLELGACDLSSAAAYSLTGAPLLASVRRLDLRYNAFRSDGLQALLDAAPPHLHTLLLYGNPVGDEGAASLAESPASDTLLELDLGGTSLGPRAARQLAQSEHLRNLLVLRLNGNRLYKEEVDALRSSPLGKRLAFLDLVEQFDDPDEIPF